jgi:hypothetical protein
MGISKIHSMGCDIRNNYKLLTYLSRVVYASMG